MSSPPSSTLLLDLPLELLYRIFSHLPLSSLYRLGSTCRRLHSLVHRNDRLWRFRLRKNHRYLLWHSDLESASDDGDAAAGDLKALVRDPTLQGDMELYLIYDKEFQAMLKSSRESNDSSSQLERLLWSILPKYLAPSSHRFIDPDHSARLALFGPGIESPNTKHLVHKIVNSHTCLFDSDRGHLVKGLPGGFGSGVRIDFRKMYKFDLMCLYTNSQQVRENQRGVDRLLAANNRLLVRDALAWEPSEPTTGEEGDTIGTSSSTSTVLHENVLKLLPTLDALIFAVDSSEVGNDDNGGGPQGDPQGGPQSDGGGISTAMKFFRDELGLMMDGLNVHNKDAPILVLNCNWMPDVRSSAPICDLAAGLDLRRDGRRPWAIFDVNILDMEGMASALDWALYHVQKRRNNLEYHHSQSAKAF